MMVGRRSLSINLHKNTNFSFQKTNLSTTYCGKLPFSLTSATSTNKSVHGKSPHKNPKPEGCRLPTPTSNSEICEASTVDIPTKSWSQLENMFVKLIPFPHVFEVHYSKTKLGNHHLYLDMDILPHTIHMSYTMNG